jgi:uncharacterized protein with HEPN domain
LQDILEAIAQIEVERRKGKAAFDASSLIQVWMVHHLMIIGEAVRSIDPRSGSDTRRSPGARLLG